MRQSCRLAPRLQAQPTTSRSPFIKDAVVIRGRMPTSYSHGFLARNLYRRTARPAGIVYWLDDAMLALTAAGLALQHTAIKSIYARSFSNLNLP